jgi:PKD repeat protein/predicted nucleotidyltransferase
LYSIENVKLSWNPVIPVETPAERLSYNIRVGTNPGGSEIMTAMASGSGIRNISSMGNCQLNTFYILKSLLPGNYYWSVQAVDHRFIGGEFSLEGGPFTIESIQASKLEAKILTNSNSSLTLKWENGNGQRRVVFCKQGSAGNANPVDSKTYTADPIFGYGDQIGTSGWYSIYNGRVDSTTIYGLTPGVAYSFHVIEYTGSTGSEVYYRTTGDANPGIFSSGLFSEQSISLYNVDNSSVAWGDYNNDGYLDILLTGNRLSTIFRNNGNNTFTDIDPGNISLEKDVDYSSASWGDYDNDGNLDILLSGYYDGGVGSVITRIFHNDYPLNSFTEQTGITLPGVRNGSAAWGDYDNDGFLDILLSGQPDPYSNGRLSVLYHNNGGNSFTEQTGTDLIQVNSSSSAWGDYDNDGYLDFLLTGHLSDGSYTGPVSKIYHNNGDKTFTEQSGISLIGVYDGSVAWGDYDNDGDLDILITGQANSGFISSIYLNNGDNTFTEQTDIHLTGMSNGSAAWGDYNNDGYLDILLTGGYNDNGTFYYVANIYRNNGNNTFTEQTGISLIGVTASSAVWGDYDNDGDLDILLTGTTQGGFGGALSKIYRNNTIMKAGDYAANLKPAAPGNILASPQPDGIKLSWAAVKTDETPFKTMTYNIRVGTTQFGFNTYTAHADATSGYRRIVAMGNTQLDNTFLIKNLPSGNYFWSVQAVDQGFMGGTWSAVNSFEVKNVQTFYSTDIVCLGFPTNFTDQSDAIDGIASWKWDFKDGTTSSLQNPDHTFATSGTYNVKLVITSNGGVKDSLEKNIFVKPRPITGFNASTTCQGTPTTITNTTDNNSLTISSWYWDFGDGLTSTVQQPDPHGYLGAGSYPVLLKALANNGCIDSISETIIVGSYPVAAVTANAPLTFCKGDSVTLSVPYNINYLYNWKVAGASITGADSSKYVAKLTGNYTVEVINSKGNCKTISSQVNVTTQNTPSIPLISTIGSLEFCQGDSAILSVANTSGYIYHWKLNGGAVGSNSDSFTAKVAGIYNLEVSNIVGCSVFSSNSVNITVNPLPSVNAVSLSGPTQFCQGGSITLSVPSNSAYSYNWRNEDGLISDANTNRYMAISSGKYQLDISNPSGCVVSTLPINVVVKTMPLKPLITSDNYQPGICLGENPIRLNISQTVPGYNYQWYKNGIPLSYATSSYLEGFLSQGDYALEADLGGCKSQSDILNVYFQDAPEKPSIYAQGPTIWYLACSNDSATQYKWYFNGNLIPGADKYLYIANQKLGEYNVSIANTKGCYTMSDTLTVPTGATGIEEVDPFEGLKIYPNPTTGMFTIEMDNPVFGELMISILDQGGKEILNIKFEKTTEHFSSQIDLSGQAKGMYLINLLLDKYLENRKIIVE